MHVCCVNPRAEFFGEALVCALFATATAPSPVCLPTRTPTRGSRHFLTQLENWGWRCCSSARFPIISSTRALCALIGAFGCLGRERRLEQLYLVNNQSSPVKDPKLLIVSHWSCHAWLAVVRVLGLLAIVCCRVRVCRGCEHGSSQRQICLCCLCATEHWQNLLKVVFDIFADKSTCNFFYTNDLHVLVDIMVSWAMVSVSCICCCWLGFVSPFVWSIKFVCYRPRHFGAVMLLPPDPRIEGSARTFTVARELLELLQQAASGRADAWRDLSGLPTRAQRLRLQLRALPFLGRRRDCAYVSVFVVGG